MRKPARRTAEGRLTDEVRGRSPLSRKILALDAATLSSLPPAGAHAASHLVNQHATPGCGALPSYSAGATREVDCGAG